MTKQLIILSILYHKKIYFVLFFIINLLDNCYPFSKNNKYSKCFGNLLHGVFWWNTMACLAFVCSRTGEWRDCVIFNDLRRNFQCCKSFKDYPFYHILIPYLYPASYFEPSKSAMRLSPSYGCLLIDVSAIKIKAFVAFNGCQCMMYQRYSSDFAKIVLILQRQKFWNIIICSSYRFIIYSNKKSCCCIWIKIWIFAINFHSSDDTGNLQNYSFLLKYKYQTHDEKSLSKSILKDYFWFKVGRFFLF